MHSSIKLKIDQPCTEHWDEMIPSDTGNFCKSCKKTVVDFTAMSDKEIHQYIHNAATPVCGRFNIDQLNKNIKSSFSRPPARYPKSIWQLLLAGTIFGNQVNGQIKHSTPPSVSYPVPAKDSIPLEGDIHFVIDAANKQPLEGATIVIDGASVTTNAIGAFRLNTLNKKITISYIGYKTKEFLLTDNPLPQTIELEQDTILLDKVVVTVGRHIVCSRTLGLTEVVVKLTSFQKVVRNIHQWLPNRNLRLFPNPVSKGQPLNIKMILPTPGKYALKIFAADGRLMHTQAVQINSPEQSIQVPTSLGFASGTYWLQLQDSFGKQKGYEMKFVVR